MNNIERPIFLIKGHIDDTLDDSQKNELQEWLACSESNRRVFERILANENLKERLVFRETFDNERHWRYIIAEIDQAKHIKPRRLPDRRSIIRYAAVVAFMAISLLAINRLQRGTEGGRSEIAAERIVPDGNRTYLELSDGTTIMLGENSGFGTFNVEGTILQEKNNTLVVNADENADTAETVAKIVVPRGRTYKVVLSDGTKVWINSDSRLEFPSTFSGTTRSVNLRGEAYFEVAENRDKPFIVHAGDMDVRVVGTTFNVNWYDESVVTTLVSGHVNLETQTGNYELRPGNQGVFTGGGMNITSVDSDKYTAWVRGLFIFDNESLESVMKTVSRWYDVNIIFTEEALKQLHFTCTVLKTQPLDQMLRILEETKLVKFDITDTVVTVSANN